MTYVEKYEEEIYLLFRRLIQKQFPDELPFFELSWDGFKYIIREWANKKPEEWSLEDYRHQILPYFASPEQFDKSVLNKIGIIIMATYIYLERLSEKPSLSRIVDIVKSFEKQFGIPDSITKDVVALIARSLEIEQKNISYGEILKAEDLGQKEYVVYINGKLKPMSRIEVEGLESKKSDYLAWAWLDEEKSLVSIDNEPKDIKPDSLLSRYLCAILKRVGKDLLHDDIEREAFTSDIHQNMNRLKKKTGHVLDGYIEAKGGRFTIHPFKSCLITKKEKK